MSDATLVGVVAAVWIAGTFALLAWAAWMDERGDHWQDGEDVTPYRWLVAFLWPVGIAVAVVSAPFFAVSFVGRWLARRRGPR